MIHFIVNTLDSDYSDLILFILLLMLWTPTLACSPVVVLPRSCADSSDLPHLVIGQKSI